MRVINFISSTGADRTVIVGDYNTYSDYEWPVEAVLNGFFLPNGCPKPIGFEPVGSEQGYGFDDSWPMTSLDKEGGLTFSNMVSFKIKAINLFTLAAPTTVQCYQCTVHNCSVQVCQCMI
jgi:hypothetical protein